MTLTRYGLSAQGTDRIVGQSFYTPSNTTGLVGHFDAAQVNGVGVEQPAVGDAVGTWTNLVTGFGNFTQATSAAKPLLQLVSGRPVLAFDGSDDFMATAGIGATYYPTNAYSQYVVVRVNGFDTNTTDGDNHVIHNGDQSTAQTRTLAVRHTDGAIQGGHWDGSVKNTFAGTSSAGDWLVIANTCAATNTRESWKGTTSASTAIGTEQSNSSYVWRIGSRVNPARYTYMDMKLLLVYNGVNHSSATAQSIISSLATFYGITV